MISLCGQQPRRLVGPCVSWPRSPIDALIESWREQGDTTTRTCRLQQGLKLDCNRFDFQRPKAKITSTYCVLIGAILGPWELSVAETVGHSSSELAWVARPAKANATDRVACAPLDPQLVDTVAEPNHVHRYESIPDYPR